MFGIREQHSAHSSQPAGVTHEPAVRRPAVNAAVTLARGDGIGPEIADATLFVLERAGARIDFDEIRVGKAVYEAGNTSGIDESAWASVRRTRVLLKGPITTPQGSGYKSLNVTLRKSLGLFANVRPCVAYAPYIRTRHPGMDVVIVRENEEDLYAGIEHRQTQDVYQCLKLITRPGCERICRYAFDYARQHGRKKVTCFVKDNIMKMTDGLFHRIFDQVAAEYPDIKADHMIVDIGAARLADEPGRFDVVVMPNLYGDILSDVAAQIAGSVGIAPSVNIGQHGAMFEAIHGSAPDIAGLDIANPSGLLLSAVQMLVHLGQGDVAARIHNAWLSTIEDGVHTADIATPGHTTATTGTSGFAVAVVERLGRTPSRLPAVNYTDSTPQPHQPEADRSEIAQAIPREQITVEAKELVGVDVFFEHVGSPDALASLLQSTAGAGSPLVLKMITNRGVKVWPNGLPETFCTDHWRCRFVPPGGGPATHRQVVDLLSRFAGAGLDFIKTEHLYTFDNKPGYALGQGQ